MRIRAIWYFLFLKIGIYLLFAIWNLRSIICDTLESAANHGIKGIYPPAGLNNGVFT
jgi:hypothetical protein